MKRSLLMRGWRWDEPRTVNARWRWDSRPFMKKKGEDGGPWIVLEHSCPEPNTFIYLRKEPMGIVWASRHPNTIARITSRR